MCSHVALKLNSDRKWNIDRDYDDICQHALGIQEFLESKGFLNHRYLIHYYSTLREHTKKVLLYTTQAFAQ